MKKSVIFLLAFALIFVFVSCGTQTGGKPSKNLKFGGKELTLKYVSSEETEDRTKVDVYKKGKDEFRYIYDEDVLYSIHIASYSGHDTSDIALASFVSMLSGIIDIEDYNVDIYEEPEGRHKMVFKKLDGKDAPYSEVNADIPCSKGEAEITFAK